MKELGFGKVSYHSTSDTLYVFWTDSSHDGFGKVCMSALLDIRLLSSVLRFGTCGVNICLRLTVVEHPTVRRERFEVLPEISGGACRAAS